MSELQPPDPPLRGARTLLRPFRIDDAKAVAESCRDSDIPRYTLMLEDMSEQDARKWILRGIARWSLGVARFAVTLPPSDVCVGQVGMHLDFEARRAEAFYWLDRDARGQGIASEVLELVTRWAFTEHGMHRAQLVTHVDNEASHRVAERCGFKREGVLRGWEPIRGEQPDVVMFGRLRSD